jgi:glycosyltransferase involved in cell wall biosynthesis
LTNSEIIEEYIKSDIVSFPTLYEGFGMPIIEGQKIGRPVLSSNIDPIIEISDGSALLIDPFDISSIRNGFIKIIEDPYFRNDLIIRGIANSRRFDSMTIAKRYIELYKKI